MERQILFDDNIEVQRHKQGAEYLALRLQHADKDYPYVASLTRYCVPGRVDTYFFDYVPGHPGFGDCVRFFGESVPSMSEALKLLQQDLNKPPVVELVMTAVTTVQLPYLHQLSQLLWTVAPKSKCYKRLTAAIKSIREARRNSIASDKAPAIVIP